MKTHYLAPTTFITGCGLLIGPSQKSVAADKREVLSSRLRSMMVSGNVFDVDCQTCLKARTREAAKKDAADWERGKEQARDAGL